LDDHAKYMGRLKGCWIDILQGSKYLVARQGNVLEHEVDLPKRHLYLGKLEGLCWWFAGRRVCCKVIPSAGLTLAR